MIKFSAFSSILISISDAALIERTVLVAGATGRTGRLIYRRLQRLSSVGSISYSFTVRALARSAAKARSVLSCSTCDSRDGIFIGDIRDPKSLDVSGAFDGKVDALVIATGATVVRDKAGNFTYPSGAWPRDVDWEGGRNLVRALGTSSSPHVVLISSMGTTSPGSALDRIGPDGFVLSYKLSLEAFLASAPSAKIPHWTTVKPCGLVDDEYVAGERQLLVGHDDTLEKIAKPVVARDDVARVVVAALMRPVQYGIFYFWIQCTQCPRCGRKQSVRNSLVWRED